MQDEYIVLDATGGKGREIFLNSSKDIGFPIDFTISKAYKDEDSKFVIEFIASTEDLDSQGHIITGQAMKEAATGLIGITLLYNHDLNRGVGKIFDAKVTKYKGKWSIILKAFISGAEQEIIQKVEDGTLDSFSIKAIIPESGRNKVWKEAEQKFITVITKMRLVEASIVTIGANSNARLISAEHVPASELQQYIQKALSTYYSKGYDNNSIDLNGGDMNNLNFSPEVIEEIQKHLGGSEPEKVEESTETAEKSDSTETVEKAEDSKLRDTIAGIMKETDIMRMKKKLEDLLRGMKEGKYPAAKAKEEDKEKDREKDKEKYPMMKSDNPDFAELMKGMSPELLKVFASQLEEEEVEKAGRKFSAKNEQMLNDIRTMLAKAVAGLEEISGKTDQKAEVKKLQDDFGNVEKYLKEITEVKDRQAVEVTEKLAVANLDLSKQNQELSGQVKDMIQKMNAILEGAPAVRNEDGTITVGKDAIKAKADTEDQRSPNAIDIITKSEKYQKMDAGEKFNQLSEVIIEGDIF